MKNVLKVDSVNKCLVMDRTFAKEAETVGSEAYMLLQNARRDYPTYTVVRRQIKRNSAKECYRGLTYEYMLWKPRTMTEPLRRSTPCVPLRNIKK